MFVSFCFQGIFSSILFSWIIYFEMFFFFLFKVALEKFLSVAVSAAAGCRQHDCGVRPSKPAAGPRRNNAVSTVWPSAGLTSGAGRPHAVARITTESWLRCSRLSYLSERVRYAGSAQQALQVEPRGWETLLLSGLLKVLHNELLRQKTSGNSARTARSRAEVCLSWVYSFFPIREEVEETCGQGSQENTLSVQ